MFFYISFLWWAVGLYLSDLAAASRGRQPTLSRFLREAVKCKVMLRLLLASSHRCGSVYTIFPTLCGLIKLDFATFG